MMNNVRIAYVDHTGVMGGAEVALWNLISFLDRDRWEPLVVLGKSGQLISKLARQSVRVEVLTLPAALIELRQGQITASAFITPAHAQAAAMYIIRLARWLRANRVHLVHANSLRACVLGSLAAHFAGIPSVWQVHSVVAFPMVSPAGVNLMRILSRRLPRHIIANSIATARCFDVPPTKMSIVPCGVQPTSCSPDGQSHVAQSRVGMIARFAPIKGQHIFLDAAERLIATHPSTQFVMAGSALFGEDGYESEMRERVCKSHMSGRVLIPGFVEDVRSLLATLDIVVHPSIQAEGFGQIVVEAMMCAKPVIVSAAGGSAELVEDGVTGRLVPPGDPVALAAAIDELLSNPIRAAEMGRRGRQRALARYDIRTTARAIEAVYERVLAAA